VVVLACAQVQRCDTASAAGVYLAGIGKADITGPVAEINPMVRANCCALLCELQRLRLCCAASRLSAESCLRTRKRSC